jgi:hypothetical protein
MGDGEKRFRAALSRWPVARQRNPAPDARQRNQAPELDAPGDSDRDSQAPSGSAEQGKAAEPEQGGSAWAGSALTFLIRLLGLILASAVAWYLGDDLGTYLEWLR